MPVYVIGSTDGPVKIGFAADPRARLGKMQSDNRDLLSVLALVPGGKEAEAALHATFASARLRGEWFSRTPDIEAFIAANRAAGSSFRARPPKDHPLERYRYGQRLTLQKLADILEVDITTVTRIIDRKLEPSFSLMRKIYLRTSGAVTPNDLVLVRDEADASAALAGADGAYLTLVAA